MIECPLVSLIVPTKNSAGTVDRCLKSLRLQDYKNIEIIVVDNFSVDETPEIARNLACKFVQLGPERSAQRNYGMKKLARGKYVMYVDSDMLLHPSLVRYCVRHIDEGASNVVGLFISEKVLGRQFFHRIKDYERQFYDGTPIDATRFIRRNSFIEVGGFDEKLFEYGSGEDWDLDLALLQVGNLSLLPQTAPKSEDASASWDGDLWTYISENYPGAEKAMLCIYHDEMSLGLVEYLKKKRYYSSGFDGYRAKWKNNEHINKQFSIAYRFFGVFFSGVEYRKSLNFWLYFVGILSIKVLVGLFYISRRRRRC